MILSYQSHSLSAGSESEFSYEVSLTLYRSPQIVSDDQGDSASQFLCCIDAQVVPLFLLGYK